MEARTVPIELPSKHSGLALVVQWLEYVVVEVARVEDAILAPSNANILPKGDQKQRPEMGHHDECPLQRIRKQSLLGPLHQTLFETIQNHA